VRLFDAIHHQFLILSSAAAKPRRASKDAQPSAARNKSVHKDAKALAPLQGHRVLSASIASFASPILFARSVPDFSTPRRLMVNESI
jgi:hypothetical protein